MSPGWRSRATATTRAGKGCFETAATHAGCCWGRYRWRVRSVTPEAATAAAALPRKDGADARHQCASGCRRRHTPGSGLVQRRWNTLRLWRGEPTQLPARCRAGSLSPRSRDAIHATCSTLPPGCASRRSGPCSWRERACERAAAAACRGAARARRAGYPHPRPPPHRRPTRAPVALAAAARVDTAAALAAATVAARPAWHGQEDFPPFEEPRPAGGTGRRVRSWFVVGGGGSAS